MKTHNGTMITRMFALLFALTLAVSQGSALAQSRPAFAFSQQELDQMLAPIALYPDALLSQVLMASTYPLEVVEAARWSKSRPDLAGDAAVRAAERENWDPSVKSLVAFPQILARMDEDLQWTQSLGDAFLDQERQVMDTVQDLRHKAQAAGNLRSDERMRVVDNGPSLSVQFFNSQVVYVPYYNPMVVYGSWWWPSHPPVYWRPWAGYYARPGYVRGFYWGSPIGISVGFFFGTFDWTLRQVRVVQVNNYYYNNVTVNRTVVVNRVPGAWRHEPEHRRGLAYRSPEMQQRFGAVKPQIERVNQAASVDTRRFNGRVDARPEVRPDARPGPRQDAAPRVGAHAAVQPAPVARPDPRVGNGNQAERRPETRAAAAAPESHEVRARGTEARSERAEQTERSRQAQARPEIRNSRPESRPEPTTRLEVPRAEARPAPAAAHRDPGANVVARHEPAANLSVRHDSGARSQARPQPST